MSAIIKTICVFILVFVQTISNAQDFQGQATYKSKRKIDIKLDSTQVNSEMHQSMLEMMKKQFEKTFTLNFNKEASIYKEDVALGSPQASVMEVVVVSTDDSDIYTEILKKTDMCLKMKFSEKCF